MYLFNSGISVYLIHELYLSNLLTFIAKGLFWIFKFSKATTLILIWSFPEFFSRFNYHLYIRTISNIQTGKLEKFCTHFNC